MPNGVPMLMGGPGLARFNAAIRTRPVNGWDPWSVDASLDYDVDDNVAILTIDGAHAFDADMFDMCCGVLPTGLIVDAFERLMRDDTITDVIVECHSPGGSVAGQDDLQRAFDALAATKSVYTIVHEECCSGLYRVLCMSDELVTTETGCGGCIGSGAIFSDWGQVDPTRMPKAVAITDMSDKFAGAPGLALDEAAIAALRAEIDPDSTRFRERVAEARGISVDEVANMAGRAFYGPELVAVGLADRVVGFDEYINEIKAQAREDTTMLKMTKPGNRKAQNAKTQNTNTKNEMAEEEITSVEALEKAYPDLVESIRKNAMDEKEEAKNEDEEETTNEDEKEEDDKKKPENARKAPATFAELDKAIPDDVIDREKVINAAQRKGLSVTEALTEALKTVNTRAKPSSIAAQADGVDGVSENGGPPTSYADAMTQVMNADPKLKRHEAVRLVNQRYPELRKAYAQRA